MARVKITGGKEKIKVSSQTRALNVSLNTVFSKSGSEMTPESSSKSMWSVWEDKERANDF
jgi:hypothetical protein